MGQSGKLDLGDDIDCDWTGTETEKENKLWYVIGSWVLFIITKTILIRIITYNCNYGKQALCSFKTLLFIFAMVKAL